VEIIVESHLRANVKTDWTLENFQENPNFWTSFYKEHPYRDQNSVSKRPAHSTQWRGATAHQNEDLNSVLADVGANLTV